MITCCEITYYGFTLTDCCLVCGTLFEDTQIELLDRCTCDEIDWEYHSCPYAEDINDDSSDSCNCCPFCESNCSNDI